MSTSRIRMSRRTTISLTIVGPLVLSACDLDPPARTVADPAVPAPLPDADVVAAVRQTILQMVSSLEVVGVAQFRLRPDLEPWLALHAAHLGVLDSGVVDEPVVVPGPAGGAPRALERLLAQEATVAAALANASREAASGDLARALASMSAAVRQRLLT